MSTSREVCVLSDGRTVKFLLHRRDGRDPFYNVRFVGPFKNRVKRSTNAPTSRPLVMRPAGSFGTSTAPNRHL